MKFVWILTRKFLYNVFLASDMSNPVANDVQLFQEDISDTWTVGQSIKLGPFSTPEQAKLEFEEELKKDYS